MKQVVQSYKTGKVRLKNVSIPSIAETEILVRNIRSLISIGTERQVIELGKKTLIGKAAARPDLVRRVMAKAQKEGLLKTYKEVLGRLDEPTPLGYSSSGEVIETGSAISEFVVGDRVACIGQGFASHAEFIRVPANLACTMPKEVSFDDASFGMLGIIALHGVRKAELSFGSTVAVMGLGLIGLLTVQILKSYGCEVISFDPDESKVKLAKSIGCNFSTSSQNQLSRHNLTVSKGYGVDAVIVAANAKNGEVINTSVELCRPKGKIVIVGTADIHPDRNELWAKEIEIVVSKAGGPGSLDFVYERQGIDLPYADVRWTSKRNLEEFLRLISIGSVKTKQLVTHEFEIELAEKAYESLLDGRLKKPVGVMLTYSGIRNQSEKSSFQPPQFAVEPPSISSGKINLGVIGAGLFSKAIMLPLLKKQQLINLHSVTTSSGVTSEHAATQFDFDFHGTNVDEIWNNDKIDGVFAATPHSEHAQHVKDAIKFNKPLLLEKPLCVSKDELEQIKKAILHNARMPVIMIGHNRRYSPHSERAKQWIGDEGSPLVISIMINPGFVEASHWVHSADQGRSRIVGEMTHFFDLAQFFSNSKISKVHAERLSGKRGKVVPNDNIVVNLKLEDGSVGSLTYSASGSRTFAREKITIFSGGSTVVIEDFRNSKLFGSKKNQTFKTSVQQMGYVEELLAFSNSIQSDTQEVTPMDFVMNSMATAFAVEESLATSKPIYL